MRGWAGQLVVVNPGEVSTSGEIWRGWDCQDFVRWQREQPLAVGCRANESCVDHTARQLHHGPVAFCPDLRIAYRGRALL
jgi:hypothetical protein